MPDSNGPLIQIIVTILTSGGFGLGLYQLLKWRPEAGSMTVETAGKVLEMQQQVLTQLRTENQALREVFRVEIEELRDECAKELEEERAERKAEMEAANQECRFAIEVRDNEIKALRKVNEGLLMETAALRRDVEELRKNQKM